MSPSLLRRRERYSTGASQSESAGERGKDRQVRV
jgi:hypothetical protein